METIVQAVNLVAFALYVLILVRVIFSWVQPRRMPAVLRWVGHVSFITTEPLLGPVRNFLFRYQRGSPVDFSPLVVYLLIELVSRLLIHALRSL